MAAELNKRVRKLVELDKEDVAWFNKTYPRGNYSWILTILLKEFRKAHKHTPQDYAVVGAAELKRMIEGEITREGENESSRQD